MAIQERNKSVDRIVLNQPMTLEALHDLMLQNAAAFPGAFKLKKGLTGKGIHFDVFMQMQPRVTIKDNTVTLRRVSNSTSVSVGKSPMMDFKMMKQSAGAIKEGGFKSALNAGPEYFDNVCTAMHQLLAPYAQG